MMDLETFDDESPVKKKSWKIRPRRSLGLPSESDWKRYVDGFDVPESLNTKIAKKRKRLSSFAGTKSQDSAASSQQEIQGYSSEDDDDDLDDVKPLPDSEIAALQTKSVSIIPRSKPKQAKRKSFVLLDSKTPDRHGQEAEAPIVSDSPVNKKSSITPRRERFIDFPSPFKQTESKASTSYREKEEASEEEIPISDYGSQSQTKSQETRPVDDLKVGDSESPCISTESSPNSVSSGIKPKVSEWMKNLQWSRKSPPKSFEEDELSQEDSAKKKKPKYQRRGLADRLQKLLTRRKSAMTIWNHRVSSKDNNNQDTKNCLVVKILDTNQEFSTLVTWCRVTPLLVGKEVDVNDSESYKAYVMFSMSNMKKLSLKKGVSLVIYPPWQSLPSAKGEKVILCTHFCKRITDEVQLEGATVSASVKDEDDKPPEDPIAVARWKCPCVADSTMRCQDCPAFTDPGASAVQEDVASQSSSNLSLPTDSQLEACLQTALWSQTSNQSRRGILECIESQGQLQPSGITVEGTVQRILYKNNPPNHSNTPLKPTKSLSCKSEDASYRVSLLLQDYLGMCCEVILPNLCQEEDRWKQLLDSGEGKCWRFHGLRKQCRTNKHRSPALFQLIETLWPKDGINLPCTSQDDSQESTQPVHQTNPQGFCYRLVSSSSESSCRLTSEQPTYRPPVISRLSDFKKESPIPHRVSFPCRVFFHRKEEGHSGEAASSLLYITDGSLGTADGETSYRKVYTTKLCHISKSLSKLLTSSQAYIVLADVSFKDGDYYCDEYSRIYAYKDLTSDRCEKKSWIADLNLLNFRKMKPRLPRLTEGCCVSEGDVFTISGKVANVDEESAYSWEECDVCEGIDFTEVQGASGVLYCAACQRPVGSPITRFNLEIYVSMMDDTSGTNITAKIKLLQRTIQKLLPKDQGDNGYDVQSVLDKPFGPVASIVVDVSPRSSLLTPREIKLEEISTYT